MNTILCQRNPLWANKKLGSSNLTIGNDGCTTTVLAMINNEFGAGCTPDQVAAHQNWYTAAGLILWNQLNLQHATFDLNGRVYGINLARILDSIKDPNKAVGLEVQIPRSKHWVLADSEAILGQPTFLTKDPWDGIECLNTKYGPVTGSVHFSKRI